MNLFPIEKRFVRYLTEKKVLKFPIMSFFSKKSRDPRRHGNVGNHLAHRMEALSEACGNRVRTDRFTYEMFNEGTPPKAMKINRNQ